MRLIGTFETEKQAFCFYSFLLKEGIQNIYEPFVEEKSKLQQYRIWVYDENDLEKAAAWLKSYKENPLDPRFQSVDAAATKVPPSPAYAEISASEDAKWRSKPPISEPKNRTFRSLTYLIIWICAVLFFYNGYQEGQIEEKKGALAAEISMTPLQTELLFDYPSSYTYIEQMVKTVPLLDYKELKDLPPDAVTLLKKAEETPSWRGIYPFFVVAKQIGFAAALQSTPMFEKISQGEIWRLFTPCLMHRDFLHILFNMAWVWILTRQIQQRLKGLKTCLLLLLIGIISNVAQYLVGGPYFLGFSGVIVGMAGFIWVRQKKAPWEGYPLQKSTVLFLLFFVISMFAIELLTFGLQLFSIIQLSPTIANTAHIVGGLTGMLLGKFSFFGRRAP